MPNSPNPPQEGPGCARGGSACRVWRSATTAIRGQAFQRDRAALFLLALVAVAGGYPGAGYPRAVCAVPRARTPGAASSPGGSARRRQRTTRTTRSTSKERRRGDARRKRASETETNTPSHRDEVRICVQQGRICPRPPPTRVYLSIPQHGRYTFVGAGRMEIRACCRCTRCPGPRAGLGRHAHTQSFLASLPRAGPGPG